VRTGERVRLVVTNSTAMWHPRYLHGHSFQLANGGARKDTVIVRPKQRVTFEFDADNPGQWLTRCHDAYCVARGMMGVFSYVSYPERGTQHGGQETRSLRYGSSRGLTRTPFSTAKFWRSARNQYYQPLHIPPGV
jgi:hypothetical protein